MTGFGHLLGRWRTGRARPLPSAVSATGVQALAHRSMLHLPAPAGRILCCLSGALWITVDGEARDVVLGPGQRHGFVRRSRAIVVALEPATCLLIVPEARCRPVAAPGAAQPVEP